MLIKINVCTMTVYFHVVNRFYTTVY